jgi:hypothetical protein
MTLSISLSQVLRMGYLPFFGDVFCSANAFVGETCVVWRNSLLFVEEIEKNMNLDKDQSSEGSDQIRRSGEIWTGFLESDGNGKGESESATRLSNSDSISVPTSLSMAPPPPSKRRSIPSPILSFLFVSSFRKIALPLPFGLGTGTFNSDEEFAASVLSSSLSQPSEKRSLLSSKIFLDSLTLFNFQLRK